VPKQGAVKHLSELFKTLKTKFSLYLSLNSFSGISPFLFPVK
jgi:hypothetical protein